MVAVARDAARAQRQAEANHGRQLRDHQRELRQAERDAALSAKEARQRYLEERLQEVLEQNAGLEESIQGLHQGLQTILERTLTIDDTITFDSLRPREKYPPLVIPKVLSSPLPQRNRDSFLSGSS